nr:hypothetical protein [Kofleriaceae bacterium]
MKILKFEGATMRDAIAKVKAELGDQAVIVATRPIRRGLLGTGYEISAAIDHDDDDDAISNGPSRGGPMSRAYNTPARGVEQVPAPAQPSEDMEKLIAPLRSELRSLRALVRAELRPTAAKASAVKPAATKPAQAQALAQASRDRADRARPAEPALVAPSIGSTIALVGPTGAGKTTTIAKLAAKAALIDNRQVQLVTLDDYRVGGVDQIRTFAELIGVPLHVAPDADQLRELCSEPGMLTLIDTAGRSPRDAGAIADLADTLRGLPGLEVHLVAPAATSPAALDALAARYRALSPARLLITKIDEVDTAPDLAKAPARLGLPLTWITIGQAVPEDIEEATATRVLFLAANGLTVGRAA